VQRRPACRSAVTPAFCYRSSTVSPRPGSDQQAATVPRASICLRLVLCCPRRPLCYSLPRARLLFCHHVKEAHPAKAPHQIPEASLSSRWISSHLPELVAVFASLSGPPHRTNPERCRPAWLAHCANLLTCDYYPDHSNTTTPPP
jgi:hypothetical protein